MSYEKFNSDLKKGKIGENEIGTFFQKRGYKWRHNPDEDVKYDIEIKKPGGPTIKIEIKTDQYELKRKTNNLAIEVFCLRRQKHSGVMASKSDYFIYYFPIEGVMYMCKTEKLKEVIRTRMTQENGGIRRAVGGDDNMAVLYLIDRTICKDDFTIIKINE